MFNAFKNLLSIGGGSGNSSRKSSSIGQNQPGIEDNVRYEVINFEIQESENIPRAKIFTGKPDEEEYESQIPEQVIKRNQSLKQKRASIEEEKKNQKEVEDESKYVVYTTTNQDTLIGLSIKFNISEAKIKLINDVSDTIFPGMKLKFPKDQCQPKEVVEELDDSGLVLRRKALSLKKEQNQQIQKALSDMKEVHRYHFYYCTPYGNIMGCLSINQGMIMFDPSLSNATNMQKLQKKRVIKFQACIDIKDINEALSLILPPRASEIVSEDSKDFVLQIALSHIGNKDIYKKYRDRLLLLKKEKKSISTVFFRVFEKDQTGADLSNVEKQEIVKSVVSLINKNVESFHKRQDEEKQKLELESKVQQHHEGKGEETNPESQKSENEPEEQKESKKTEAKGEEDKEKEGEEEGEQESLTILPFFDILYENIVNKKKQPASHQENEQSELNEWLASEFAPKMNESSTILTQDIFLQIIFYVPSMYRFTNWKIVYSNLLHGMSFQTLMRNCEDESPLFIVVQTFQNDKFGAYLSDAIHSGFHFYGTGECFLFKFNEEQRIKVFHSTGKNEHFIFSNPDGLGIGCGEKYGLFIHNDIYKGETNCCDTFDNEVLLSDPEKNLFKIKAIEIWGLEM